MQISVIVPVYNGEKYIRECLDSIFSQTFTDFEIIIVDDGSTDNTFDILTELSVKCNNLSIIRQENKGVSCARNTGIKHAKGKYLCFIDSDDYIKNNFLEELTEVVREKNVDWVLSGNIEFDDKKVSKKLILPEKEYVLSKEIDCLQFFNLSLLTAPFAKLYRRDIIINNNLLFNEKISYAEDREFNTYYAQNVQNVKSISYIGYYYRTDSINSLSKKKRSYKFKYDLFYWELLKNNFICRNHCSNEVNAFLVNVLYHSVNDNIKLLAESYSPKEMNSILSDVVSYIDKKYLKRYWGLIKANAIQKYLILYIPLVVLLKIYYHKYGKQN